MDLYMLGYYLSVMDVMAFIKPNLPDLPTSGSFSKSTVKTFRTLVYRYYDEYGRRFPWRNTRNPYRILVSEVMLQQTQVDRVVEKYESFVKRFPDIPALACAPLDEVLSVWKGLGYNRRCLALKRSAELILDEYGCVVPDTLAELIKLPGVGPATAAGIRCFAYGKPALYLETNIRTLFIHLFFSGRERVHDGEILPLLERTLERDDPRNWYFALMDYGAMLKREVGNLSNRSSHYVKQPPFKGSDRQLRGRILELLLANRSQTTKQIANSLREDTGRVAKIITSLEWEGFIQRNGQTYTISQ
jgi:A/G-specific adenine glycosylase